MTAVVIVLFAVAAFMTALYAQKKVIGLGEASLAVVAIIVLVTIGVYMMMTSWALVEASSAAFRVMVRQLVASAAAAAAVVVAVFGAAIGMVPNGWVGGEEIMGKTILAML